LQSGHLELITLKKGKVLVAPTVSCLLIIACWSTGVCMGRWLTQLHSVTQTHQFLIKYVGYQSKVLHTNEEDSAGETRRRLMENETGNWISVYFNMCGQNPGSVW